MLQLYDKIREESEALFPHLLDLEQKGGMKAEEVLSLIQQDKASFLICDEGFVIAYISDGGSLFWILTAHGVGDVFWKYIEDLETIAEESGCTEIGFNTVRRGFARRLRGTGYRAVVSSGNSVEYRKKLNG